MYSIEIGGREFLVPADSFEESMEDLLVYLRTREPVELSSLLGECSLGDRQPWAASFFLLPTKQGGPPVVVPGSAGERAAEEISLSPNKDLHAVFVFGDSRNYRFVPCRRHLPTRYSYVIYRETVTPTETGDLTDLEVLIDETGASLADVILSARSHGISEIRQGFSTNCFQSPTPVYDLLFFDKGIESRHVLVLKGAPDGTPEHEAVRQALESVAFNGCF